MQYIPMTARFRLARGAASTSVTASVDSSSSSTDSTASWSPNNRLARSGEESRFWNRDDLLMGLTLQKVTAGNGSSLSVRIFTSTVTPWAKYALNTVYVWNRSIDRVATTSTDQKAFLPGPASRRKIVDGKSAVGTIFSSLVCRIWHLGFKLVIKSTSWTWVTWVPSQTKRIYTKHVSIVVLLNLRTLACR